MADVNLLAHHYYLAEIEALARRRPPRPRRWALALGVLGCGLALRSLLG